MDGYDYGTERHGAALPYATFPSGLPDRVTVAFPERDATESYCVINPETCGSSKTGQDRLRQWSGNVSLDTTPTPSNCQICSVSVAVRNTEDGAAPHEKENNHAATTATPRNPANVAYGNRAAGRNPADATALAERSTGNRRFAAGGNGPADTQRAPLNLPTVSDLLHLAVTETDFAGDLHPDTLEANCATSIDLAALIWEERHDDIPVPLSLIQWARCALLLEAEAMLRDRETHAEAERLDAIEAGDIDADGQWIPYDTYHGA